MKITERRWRAALTEALAALDAALAGDALSYDARTEHIVLRDRVAGCLGAEEGRFSTPELRARAARDYEAARALVGGDAAHPLPALSLPQGGAPAELQRRVRGGYQAARPRTGGRA